MKADKEAAENEMRKYSKQLEELEARLKDKEAQLAALQAEALQSAQKDPVTDTPVLKTSAVKRIAKRTSSTHRLSTAAQPKRRKEDQSSVEKAPTPQREAVMESVKAEGSAHSLEAEVRVYYIDMIEKEEGEQKAAEEKGQPDRARGRNAEGDGRVAANGCCGDGNVKETLPSRKKCSRKRREVLELLQQHNEMLERSRRASLKRMSFTQLDDKENAVENHLKDEKKESMKQSKRAKSLVVSETVNCVSTGEKNQEKVWREIQEWWDKRMDTKDRLFVEVWQPPAADEDIEGGVWRPASVVKFKQSLHRLPLSEVDTGQVEESFFFLSTP